MELIDRDVLFNSFNDCSCECGVCQYSLDGLPCGLIENAPTVEAIPKDQYEARLKADLVAMLTEIQLEIEEKEQYYQDKFLEEKNAVHDAAMGGRMFGCGECKEVIQQKINALEEQEDGTNKSNK